MELKAPWELDPHLFFGVHHSAYIDKLEYSPASICVLEVGRTAANEPTSETTIVNDHEVIKWVETDHGCITEFSKGPGRKLPLTPRLTLIFTAAQQTANSTSAHPKDDQTEFPSDYDSIPSPSRVPFYHTHFPKVINKLSLPSSTPWLLQSKTSNFQSYNLGKSRIGLTLRTVNRGMLAADFALSMSYCTKTGEINALLLGVSPNQAEYIRQRVSELKEYAFHPALLPTILHSCTRSLLQRLIHKEHSEMYAFEGEAKGTDVVICNEGGVVRPKGLSNKAITSAARGILQRVTAWECHSKSLLLEVDALTAFVTTLSTSTQTDQLNACGEIITERLRFISNKTNEILLVVQLVKDRASMQLAAFSNVLAQQNYETSLEIARSTSVDGTSMRSIAMLTMWVLPVTFLATYFSTPFMVEHSPSQTFFWILACPLALLFFTLAALLQADLRGSLRKRFPRISGWLKRRNPRSLDKIV